MEGKLWKEEGRKKNTESPNAYIKKIFKKNKFFLAKKITLANKCLFWLVVEIHSSQLLILSFEEI